MRRLGAEDLREVFIVEEPHRQPGTSRISVRLHQCFEHDVRRWWL